MKLITRKLKKPIAALLAVLLIVSVLPAVTFPAAAASYSDTSKHWAEACIERWHTHAVIRDDNGKFLPDKPITRGEFAYMLDRVMKYQTAAQNKFSDLSSSDPNYDAILKANAADVLRGTDDNRVLSSNNITREEAATMFARAFKIDHSENGSTTFKDDSKISAYAKGACEAMQKLGYMQGMGNGEFSPKTNLTRAQALTMLDRIAKNLSSSSGTLSSNISGNLIVQSSGVTVGSITVSGDVYIAPGVGSGSVTFNGTNITGKVIVLGGGPNSVSFNSGARCSSVEAMRTDGSVAIKTDSASTVSSLNIKNGSGQVTLTGNFTGVSVSTATPAIMLSGAKVSTLALNVSNAKLELDSNSSISELTVPSSSTGTSIVNRGTLSKVNFSSKTTVTGTGSVDTANISGNIECSFQTTPRQISLGSSSSATVDSLTYRNSGSSTQSVYPGDIYTSSGAPAVQSVTTNASLTTITITFNKTILNNLGSIASLKNAITLSRDNGSFLALSSSDSVSVSGNSLVITLITRLSGTNNKIRLDGGSLRDVSGNVLQLQITAPTSYNTTVSGTGLYVTSLTPATGTSYVTSPVLTMTFNKSIARPQYSRYISLYSSNGTLIEQINTAGSQVSVSGSVATITLTSSFLYGGSYYVLVENGAFVSLNDNDVYAGITNANTWYFSTSYGGGGLTVTSLSPANNSTNVNPGLATLVMTFNKRPSRPVTNRYIHIYASNGTKMESIDVYNNYDRITFYDNTNTVAITPTLYFTSGMTYYVLIDDGAFVSYADNDSYAGINYTTGWRFTVGGATQSVTIGNPSVTLTAGRTASTYIPLTISGFSSSDVFTVTSSNDLNWTVPTAVYGTSSALTITPKTGGLKAGRTTITISRGSVVYAQKEIVVSGGTFTVGTPDPEKLMVGVTNTVQVTPVNMAAGQTVTVTSSNTSVATVSCTPTSSAEFTVTITPKKTGTFKLVITSPGATALTTSDFTVEAEEDKVITAIETPASINGIVFGTEFADLKGLPTFLAVEIKGQTGSYPIPVTWSEDDFDGTKFDEPQELTGSLDLTGYKLDSSLTGKKVKLTITVDKAVEIKSVSLPSLKYDPAADDGKGAFVDEEPPETVGLILDNNIEIEAEVVWSLPPTDLGVMTGTLTLPAGVSGNKIISVVVEMVTDPPVAN